MNETLWTARELAKFLGYCESTVARMVSEKPHKLPPRVATLTRPRWLPETVHAWAASNSVMPRAPHVGRPRKVV